MAQQQVFISYAWGGESEKVAEEIEARLTAQGIDLIRDKTDLGFKGLIREFMERIGQGNFVVLIISDKYLKSKNCMFELLEVAKKGEFHNRVFPVVLPDANIYDSLVLIDYYHFWQQKISDLNAKIKTLSDLSDTRKVIEELDLYTDIRAAIDDLAGKLSNMNTLTLEIMRTSQYLPLVQALQLQGGKVEGQSQKIIQPSKKEGKILYHIPNMMQVEKWTRCTVRLAWEELLLKEGLKIPEQEQVVESIRLGNVMQVSLNEGRDGQNFEIKFLNNEEQVIFEDDFTEWLFDVKARTIGNFTLILRVTLIQIIEGKERKKDIVLERDVITEAIVPTALAKFETAENGLSLPNSNSKSLGKSVTDSFAGPHHQTKEYQSPPMASPIPTEQWQSPAGAAIPSSRSATYGSAAPQKSLFKRVLPYAASLMILIVAGIVFIEQNGSSYQESYPSGTTAENTEGYAGNLPSIVTSENPNSEAEINPDENMLVALSLESSTPSGETINETMLFVVSGTSVDSLNQIDPGNYSIRVYPVSDTTDKNLGAIKEFSVLKIEDSVRKASIAPALVGEQLIERENLRVTVGPQIVRTKPQPLDSATSQKLRLSTRKIRAN